MAEGVSYCRIPADASERWKVVRDVCAGDQALRQGDYLPYLNKLDRTPANIDRNAAYRNRAVLYAATSFTRDGLLGLAFRFDPRAKLPAKLKYLETDCDGSGTSIYQQSQASLGHIVEIGRHGLFVDFSAALQRPIIKGYTAENIINWRESQVDGKTVTTLVVLKEEAETSDGFAVKKEPQYRELALEDGVCVCRLWRDGKTANAPAVRQKMKDAEGNEVDQIELRSAGKPLDFIPFFPIGSESNTFTIDPSPLYGLAKVNIAHFRNSADYEDSVFFVGQVQPWISGLDQEWRDHLENPKDEQGRPTGQVLYIGSRSPILLPTGGAFGFAQAQPNMLAKEAMDQKEKMMVALGARIIDATIKNKTATGEDNDREASTSVLALCCSNISEAYQAAIRACGRYLDMNVDGEEFQSTYKINQDFVKAVMDPAIMAQIVAAWQAGVMAKADVRAFFRRLGSIATERTDEKIDSDLETEGPPLGTINDDEPPPRKEPAGADA